MTADLSRASVHRLLVAILTIAATSTLCLEYRETPSEFEPLLCTVEEEGQLADGNDIVQVAEDMASSRLQDVANFSVNRTVVSPDEIFGFVKNGCSLLNPYCSAVITVARCPVVLVVNDWTAETSIPHLIYSTQQGTCHVTSDHGIQIAPAGPVKSNVVHILVKKIWKSNKLVFIYDDFLDLDQMSLLQLVLSNSSVISSVFNINDDFQDQILDNIIGAIGEMRRVFLAVSSERMRDVLEKASMQGLLTQDYEWIIMSNTTCMNALNITLPRRSNVLFLQQAVVRLKSEGDCWQVKSGQQQSFQEQADLLSAGIEALIRGSLAVVNLHEKIYRSSTVCAPNLVNLRRKAILETRQMIVRTDVGDVIFGSRDGKLTNYGFDFCSTDDMSPIGYSVVGSWSPVTGIESEPTLFRNAFKDFGGRKLVLGSLEASPFVMKKQSGNVTYYEGFCIDLLNELASKLNFTYEITTPVDEVWGAPDENGSWNGVVGMVLRREVEFGVGPLTITDVRESVIDFTIPYLEDGAGIITKRSKTDSYAMFRLFTPLQPIVWTCLGASIVGVSLILYIVNRQSPSAAADSAIPDQERLTLFTCFWAILGSTLNQGSEVQPRSASGRLVLGSWWVFTIIFVSTYTANMAAVLTITIYDKPINSLTQLAGQSEIKPLVKFGSNIHTLFKEARNEIYQEIWRKMDSSTSTVRTNEEALALVKSKNIAFMTDRTQLEYIVTHDCESYSLADDVFNTGGMGFAVAENAPYLTAFDLIIMKLQESGIIDGWRMKWWSSQGNKCKANSQVNAVDQLDLLYLAGPFFIFLGAMTLSIVLVVIEKICIADKCRSLRGALQSRAVMNVRYRSQ